MSKETTTTKDNKMELNRISISIISVLVTLAISLAGFSYRTGTTNNELKNIKEQQLIIKNDLKEEIHKKADKQIVDLIFVEINKINGKLDRLIENKEK